MGLVKHRELSPNYPAPLNSEDHFSVFQLVVLVLRPATLLILIHSYQSSFTRFAVWLSTGSDEPTVHHCTPPKQQTDRIAGEHSRVLLTVESQIFPSDQK